MIPLGLVTGFLGSGKTTLLRAVAAENRHRRLAYLVNEFSSLDVDGALLSAEGVDAIRVPGGSIFCRCLVTEFVGHLRRIAEDCGTTPAGGARRQGEEVDAAGASGIEGLVVEASGISDPRVLGTMLRETRLDGAYRLASTTTVVDPCSLPKLLRTLPSIRAQIECADTILINKADLGTEEAMAEAEALVRALRPSARIVRTVRCRPMPALFEETGLEPASKGDYAPCRDPLFEALAVPPASEVSVEELRSRLEALASEIYRVKGIVRSGGRLQRIDFGPSGFSAAPAEAGAAATGLAVIARGGSPAAAAILELLGRH